MSKQHTIVVLYLNIGFVVMLFSGCYSAMHSAQIDDGLNVTLALYPVHHEIEYLTDRYGSYRTSWDGNSSIGSYDVIYSAALRYGWAVQQVGELKHSIGIAVDLINSQNSVNTEVMVRSDYFVQLSDNPIVDYGIGIEGWLLVIPSTLYIVLSRDIGDRWTIYTEERVGWVMAIGSLGVEFDISECLSILAGVSLMRYRNYGCPRYGSPDGTIENAIAPLVGIGVVYHLPECR